MNIENKIKRYIVFTYPSYDKGGGWHDFKGSFDSFEKAHEHATKHMNGGDNNGHIIDSETGEWDWLARHGL